MRRKGRFRSVANKAIKSSSKCVVRLDREQLVTDICSIKAYGAIREEVVLHIFSSLLTHSHPGVPKQSTRITNPSSKPIMFSKILLHLFIASAIIVTVLSSSETQQDDVVVAEEQSFLRRGSTRRQLDYDDGWGLVPCGNKLHWYNEVFFQRCCNPGTYQGQKWVCDADRHVVATYGSCSAVGGTWHKCCATGTYCLDP